MKALITLLGLVFSLNAGALSGTMEVTNDSLRVVRDDGFKVHFYQGKYPASLIFKDQKAYLTITRKDIATNTIMKFPSGTSIPENGEFLIDGTKTGQTFLIDGNITTTITNSETINEQESCRYSREERVCRGRGRSRQCRWETVYYNGLREVEFYYQTKTVDLATQLKSDNGGRAVFAAKETNRNKIFTYTGDCY